LAKEVKDKIYTSGINFDKICNEIKKFRKQGRDMGWIKIFYFHKLLLLVQGQNQNIFVLWLIFYVQPVFEYRKQNC